MKVLVLGSGAREHALAAALRRSPKAPEVFVAPGNDGMEDVATPLAMGWRDLQALASWARREGVALAVAGSEEPLVLGAHAVFAAQHVPFFGPSAAASRLEGSKVWAKAFMQRHGIPTAAFQVHDDLDKALAALSHSTYPCVIKADGLAAGKGVHVVSGREEAERVLRAMLVHAVHGDAGRRVVIEELLEGEELSVFALSDGYTHRILGCAQDHKRAFRGDRGPNTGGMGAFSPVPHLEPPALRFVEARILAPTLAGMVDEGTPYRGFLYLGLMVTPAGPKVLEYNCRLGDPEAQVLLPRLQTDLLAALLACAGGDVAAAPLTLDPSLAAVGVVIASEGYPDAPRAGQPITGIEAARERGALVYCAGVAGTGEARRSRGGRILTVVGLGADLAAAQRQAYAGVECVQVPHSFHRDDIAQRALEKGPWTSRVSAS